MSVLVISLFVISAALGVAFNIRYLLTDNKSQTWFILSLIFFGTNFGTLPFQLSYHSTFDQFFLALSIIFSVLGLLFCSLIIKNLDTPYQNQPNHNGCH